MCNLQLLMKATQSLIAGQKSAALSRQTPEGHGGRAYETLFTAGAMKGHFSATCFDTPSSW